MFKGLSHKLSGVFRKLRSKGKLNQDDVNKAMREIKLALLEADVNYDVVKKFVNRVTELSIGSEILSSLTPGQQVIKIVNDELSRIMGGLSCEPKRVIEFSSSGLTTVMVCGLQGSGKTTNSAKLALYYLQKKYRPLLVACDVYRPAAIEQLIAVGEKIKVNVYSERDKTPVEIAKNSLAYAKDYGHDLVIFDTAGRLHIDEELMSELKCMQSEIKLNEILLVVDSMAGQDAVNMAKKFDEQLGVDGVILTKLDSDSRGGAAISILEVTGKPIKFIGTGETMGDFEVFKPDRMASRILGMGDVLTLIEKAKESVSTQNVNQLTNKLKTDSFDMEDLLTHMKQIEKIGSMRKIIDMIPGMSNKISNSDIESGKVRMLKTQAIISSMTKEERKKPTIINYSRKQRVAKGSGTEISDVNLLLKQFEQKKKFFKQFSNKRGLFSRNMFSKFGPH